MIEDAEIRQVVKFNGPGCSKAAVTFRVGPIIVRGARLMEKDGKCWLAMPSRKMSNGNWLNLVSFCTADIKEKLMQMVLQVFQNEGQGEEALDMVPAF